MTDRRWPPEDSDAVVFAMTMTKAAFLLGLALLASPAAAQPAHHTAPVSHQVTLVGPTGRTLTLSAGDLEHAARSTVRMDIHGEHHVFEGAQLGPLLARVGALSGETLRGAALMDVLIVTARDGYQVVLTLAEIDPAMRPNANVILADHDNGGVLSDTDGPFRLAVDGDLRPARSARIVTRIEVRQLRR